MKLPGRKSLFPSKAMEEEPERITQRRWHLKILDCDFRCRDCERTFNVGEMASERRHER